jgi:MFS superfamily sulfate permease-like transporter
MMRTRICRCDVCIPWARPWGTRGCSNGCCPGSPGYLVAVVLAILAVNLFDLTSHGVKVVGALPEGFPPFTIPTVPVADLGLLFAGALGIALVSLTDTISTASAFAARTGDQVDGNKEMIGIGAANIAAGPFQGFPASTSGSRTAVAAQNGAKTQVTGLVGARFARRAASRPSVRSLGEFEPQVVDKLLDRRRSGSSARQEWDSRPWPVGPQRPS